MTGVKPPLTLMTLRYKKGTFPHVTIF